MRLSTPSGALPRVFYTGVTQVLGGGSPDAPARVELCAGFEEAKEELHDSVFLHPRQKIVFGI